MAKSSQVPDGGYNPQLGSNYMLDGFDFDSEYGEGAENARKDPDPGLPRSSRGLAVLPDGFLGADPAEAFDFRALQASDDEGGLGNISGMYREATPLMDLSWLEGAEQDPERLPEAVNLVEYDLNDLYQTTVSDVPDSGTRAELEEAWGVNRRTDGQNLVPNIEYPRPVTGPTSALPGDQFRDVVAHAMRRSAFGVDLDTIARDVLAFLGDPASVQGTPAFRQLTAALRAVRAEHGLVGNVYVRDSAFPAILSGKWDAAIKKRCASARYFLTAKGSKLSNQSRYLGKEVVTAIPWAEAADHYRPILAAGGKRLASGDPRRALQAAFISHEELKARATQFQTHEMAPQVSTKEARAAFAKAEVVAPVAPVLKNASLAFRKKADARIERWVRAGLLTAETASEMRARISDPYELYRSAAQIVASAATASKEYTGPAFAPLQSERKEASAEKPVEVRRLLRWASKQMNEGAAGGDLDYLLNARFSGELLKQASEPLVQIRKKHEGLAGHLYVEASVYASPTGTAGCEAGALVHRANALKAVLGMDRCTSCASNVEDTCQKYNKTIVASAPVKNPARFQAETIRLANSNDAEHTASYFAPSYENEYDLQNDSLDDIEYSNTPTAAKLGSILFFEGWRLPDEE